MLYSFLMIDFYKISVIRFAIKNDKRHEIKWDDFKVIAESNFQFHENYEIEFVEMSQQSQDVAYAQIAPCSNVFLASGNLVFATNDWDKFLVITSVPESLEIPLAYIFYTHAVRRQMLQLHCATIDDGGRGVLFLGPSGIGKTTQAERWAEFRGASIINGDVGFVQRTEREYIAWGTPWHGSSPYCLNASVPVKALVVLKQAPENRLRELTGFEKVSEIAGSVFYPTWLEDGMELCTDTLNHLLTDLPVYRLDNRADRESVEILAKELDRIT